MPIIEAHPEHSLVVDNDVFTHWRAQKPQIVKNMEDYFAIHKKHPALPSITVFETYQGFENAIRKAGSLTPQIEEAKLWAQELIDQLIVLPVDEKVSEIAAYIVTHIGRANANRLW